MGEFIEEEVQQTVTSEDVVRDAFLKSTHSHRESIRAEYQRRQDVIMEIERKKIEKEEFRQRRRDAREARRK